MASDPDAFRETFPLHASGYLLHPVSDEQVAAELSDLRYPPAETPEKLRVQTFGNFAVFYRGQPVRFHRTRTRELFAYLIDRRGRGQHHGELVSILWEGRPDTPSVRSQLRSLIADLRTTLAALDSPPSPQAAGPHRRGPGAGGLRLLPLSGWRRRGVPGGVYE